MRSEEQAVDVLTPVCDRQITLVSVDYRREPALVRERLAAVELPPGAVFAADFVPGQKPPAHLLLPRRARRPQPLGHELLEKLMEEVSATGFEQGQLPFRAFASANSIFKAAELLRLARTTGSPVMAFVSRPQALLMNEHLSSPKRVLEIIDRHRHVVETALRKKLRERKDAVALLRGTNPKPAVSVLGRALSFFRKKPVTPEPAELIDRIREEFKRLLPDADSGGVPAK